MKSFVSARTASRGMQQVEAGKAHALSQPHVTKSVSNIFDSFSL